eukprot:3132029-Prymnesium_polylepis.1
MSKMCCLREAVSEAARTASRMWAFVATQIDGRERADRRECCRRSELCVCQFQRLQERRKRAR